MEPSRTLRLFAYISRRRMYESVVRQYLFCTVEERRLDHKALIKETLTNTTGKVNSIN